MFGANHPVRVSKLCIDFAYTWYWYISRSLKAQTRHGGKKKNAPLKKAGDRRRHEAHESQSGRWSPAFDLWLFAGTKRELIVSRCAIPYLADTLDPIFTCLAIIYILICITSPNYLVLAMSNTVLTGLAIAATDRGDNSWWADAMSIGHIDGAFRPMNNTAIGRYVRYDFACLVIIFIGKWIKIERTYNGVLAERILIKCRNW